MTKRLIASSLAAAFSFGTAFGLALSSAITQNQATAQGTPVFSVIDDCSEILSPGALSSDFSQANQQAFCQWYRQLPEPARKNLQADAMQSGVPTGDHALHYYLDILGSEPK
jgi:hypothetical protein